LNLQDVTVIDFETSGLDPVKDRIIEIAAIRCSGGEVVSQFSTLVQFEGTLAPKITELTGIHTHQLAHGMDEDTALRILNRMLGSNLIVAHNAAFDLSFLHYSLLRIAGRSFRNPFIDTLTIARDRHTYPHTLGEMCGRYGIALENAHRALADVMACWELLQRMNEEKSVQDDINRLSYIKKYGAPRWYPEYAQVEPVELKFA
jgi:DNA polymerase III subunit epsilon